MISKVCKRKWERHEGQLRYKLGGIPILISGTERRNISCTMYIRVILTFEVSVCMKPIGKN